MSEDVTSVDGQRPVFDMTVLPSQDSPYGVLVRDMCEALYASQSSVLQGYWDVGSMLHKFVVEQLEGGNKKNIKEIIEKLSADVHAVSGGQLDYGESTLRKMLTFRGAVSKEQLERLKLLGVPVSKALSMCIGDVTDGQRDTIIEELESGALDSSAVPDRVRELSPPEDRSETRGGAQAGPFQTLGKIEKSLVNLRKTIDNDATPMSSAVLTSGNATDADMLAYKDQMTKINNLFVATLAAWEVLYTGHVTEEKE